MALEIQLFQAQEKWKLGGKKKILQDLRMELPFPPLGFGAGAKPVLPARSLSLFPLCLPARMRPRKAGDYPGQLRKISSKNRGKTFWKGDFGSGNAWEGGAALPSLWDCFFHRFSSAVKTSSPS